MTTETDQTGSDSKIIDAVDVGKPSSKHLERSRVTEIETSSTHVPFNIVEKLLSNNTPPSLPPVNRCNENLWRLNPVTSKPEYQLDQPNHTTIKETFPEDHNSTAKISSIKKGK